jgi:PTS system nitrogen regulatory IIA component
MRVRDFLSQSNAITNVRTHDKRRLLKEICDKAASALKLDADLVFSDILKREELGSTGVGGGVALPHIRVRELKAPFGLLARLQSPIEFDAIDGQPVDVVFLLLLPAEPAGEQLNTLATAARKLRDPNVVRDLRRAADSASLYRAMVAESE